MAERQSSAPVTRNPEAAALISRAIHLCRGCRTSWRLRNGKHKGGLICTAVSIRRSLNEIAAKVRT